MCLAPFGRRADWAGAGLQPGGHGNVKHFIYP